MASMAKYAKQDFSSVLHEELKCSKCQNGVIAGKHLWYKCIQGHMVCQDCFRRLAIVGDTNCRKCTCGVTPCGSLIPSGHCKISEALLKVETMRFKCKNLARGCQEIMREENMIYHQSECIHRLVQCPLPHCGLKVPFNELLDHVAKSLRSSVECKQLTELSGIYNMIFHVTKKLGFEIESNLPVRCCFFPTMLLNLESSKFFMSFDVQNDVFYHWISYVGPARESKHFIYTLTYQNQGQNPTIRNTDTMRYTGQVISIDKTPKAIISEGNCLGIPLALFESKFLGKNRNFNYSINIRKMKEGDDDDWD